MAPLKTNGAGRQRLWSCALYACATLPAAESLFIPPAAAARSPCASRANGAGDHNQRAGAGQCLLNKHRRHRSMPRQGDAVQQRQLVGTTTADGSGHWSINDIALSNGANYSFTATATDAANNTSGPSNALPFHDDQTPPAAPVITTTAPAQNNASSINIAGTAEANSTVTLSNNGSLGWHDDGRQQWTLERQRHRSEHWGRQQLHGHSDGCRQQPAGLPMR